MDKKGKVALIVALVLVGILLVSIAIAKPGTRAPRAKKECRDGLDNDGDGNIDWPDDSGCINKNDNDETDCGDGVCEGGETLETCPEDCGVPDSCADTDGSYDPFVLGTVSGYETGEPYNHTDFCGNSVFLVEFYCSGDSYGSNNFSCVTNLTTTCNNGACI